MATPARSVGVLALLALALPLNATVTGVALAVDAVRRGSRRSPLVEARAQRASRPRVGEARRTVLVSGGKMTKALELCRAFHAAGHRVVLVETGKYRLTGHRFSRSVDAFHVVPAVHDPGYAQGLLDVVEREDVDVYVPVCSPAASLPDARAGEVLAGHCEVVHPTPEQVELLDDKHAFAKAAEAMGLSVPDTHLVTDAAQVLDPAFPWGDRPYILKSIAYDPVHRLDLTRLPFPGMAAFVESLPISPANPWILQEYVEGVEYCTHGTARDGRLTVYLCCESSAFQVNYAMVDKPAIRAWVERFVDELGLTGQASFDFIEAADGTPYAIECNPRTHSAITLLRGHPGLAAAYLDKTPDDAEPVVADVETRPTYWIYHELWRLLTRPSLARVRTILGGRDAIFDRTDPLPFLLVPHLQLPSLLLSSLRRGGSWIRVDFNIGKLVEPSGD